MALHMKNLRVVAVWYMWGHAGLTCSSRNYFEAQVYHMAVWPLGNEIVRVFWASIGCPVADTFKLIELAAL